MNGRDLYHSPDRLVQWEAFMRWWWDNINPFFGSGGGSFQWLGPNVQGVFTNPDPKAEFYMWAHNDILQAYLEQGLIGLGLAMSLLGVCLNKAWSRPWLIVSIAGVCACMLVQFPLRYVPGQLLVLALVRLSLEDEK